MSQSFNKPNGRRAPLPAVLQSVKHDTRNLLADRLHELFHSTDDALFELADRAATGKDQNLYFDSMRIVRLQRASLQQKYIDAYSRSWSGVMSGELAAAPRSQDTADSTLSPDAVLELTQATAAINSKAADDYLLLITELATSLTDVCGHELAAELNPLGPHCLSQNLIAATHSLDVPVEVRILLLTLFERHVFAELAPVYERANAILSATGARPQMPGRSETSSDHTAAQADAAAGTTSETPILLEPVASIEDALDRSTIHSAAQSAEASEPTEEFLHLQRLLTIARDELPQQQPQAQALEDSYPADDTKALVSTPQLMQVLGLVQFTVNEEPLDLDAPAAPIDFREVLTQKTPEVTGNNDTQLETESDDVVDLVEMLFDYILKDANLAIPMKALIGRLQIPVLKVALIDQSFFATHSHPARQLLNELAAAGIGWSSANELKRDETYNKIESIVQRVTDGFVEDLTLFSNLIAELRHFAQKELKKRNQVEQRVKETEATKAKTREAKKTVQTLLNQTACGLQLPLAAGQFVSDAWSQVLVYLFITQGTDSEAWVEAIETLDDLLWAAQPLSNETDVALREGLLPNLLTQVEAGITLANLSDAQEQLYALCDTIEERHQTDLGLLDSDAPTPDEPLVAGPMSITEQPAIVLVPDADAPPEELENLADTQFVEKIIQVTAGQWVELRETNGAMTRCKLATIVQPGNRYVFVNRKGMKVCERTRNELALALQGEDLHLLDESEMFDRALESVVGDLQQLQDSKLRALER